MTPNASISRGSLEELGLYNVLTRVAVGDADVDPFLLATLREKGFVALDAMSLTEAGLHTLKALTIRMGWFYPELDEDIQPAHAHARQPSANDDGLVKRRHLGR
jgi:hypothetical protein